MNFLLCMWAVVLTVVLLVWLPPLHMGAIQASGVLRPVRWCLQTGALCVSMSLIR